MIGKRSDGADIFPETGANHVSFRRGRGERLAQFIRVPPSLVFTEC